MKFLKRFFIFVLLSLFLTIFINSFAQRSTVERILIDRYVVENQNSSKLYIATVTIEPKIVLKDNIVISKVFEEIKHFLSVETTSPLGFILIKDFDSELELFIDKQGKSIYFEENKNFSDSDCVYFISKLMKHIDWNVD